jgi:hypothetical protein
MKRENTKRGRITVIENTVIDYFETDKQTVYMKSRRRELVECRSLIYYFVRRYTSSTLDKCGDLGQNIKGCKTNHATVLNGINNILDAITYDKVMISHVSSIEVLLSEKLNINPTHEALKNKFVHDLKDNTSKQDLLKLIDELRTKLTLNDESTK